MTKVLTDKDLFKNIVLKMNLRNTESSEEKKSFGRELFKKSSWFYLKEKIKTVKAEKISKQQVETIKSLNKFVVKKLQNSPENRFKIKGGEVSSKSDQVDKFNFQIAKFEGDKTINIISENFLEKYKVVFIGLEPKDIKESDLLSKMIFATKIQENDFLKIYIEKNTTVEELFCCIKEAKIDYIVSLGARATNLLLNSKNKMTEVHGQFLDIEVNCESKIFNSVIMPLFHPALLNINLSMKKSAWTDLQKLMSKL